jgi:hypothetical protein
MDEPSSFFSASHLRSLFSRATPPERIHPDDRGAK